MELRSIVPVNDERRPAGRLENRSATGQDVPAAEFRGW